MRYHEFEPAPEVAGLVLRYWSVLVPAGVATGHAHRVLPDGCINLVAMSRGTFTHLALQGPGEVPFDVPVEPGDRYWGVRFWPDTGGLMLGVDPAALAASVRPAAEVLGPDAGALAAALAGAATPEVARRQLDGWVAGRARGAGPPDRVVRLAVIAVAAANGGLHSAELARLTGLGVRQLQRRFRRACGITLKTFGRIRRLRASLDHLVAGRPRPWATVAAELGFADQAHLVREFTRLAGLTPREVAAYVARIDHVNVRP